MPPFPRGGIYWRKHVVFAFIFIGRACEKSAGNPSDLAAEVAQLAQVAQLH